MACTIMLYLDENEEGKFTYAKLLTSRIICENNQSRRYHHQLQMPGNSNWSLREVRKALSLMINGATHSGGRWYWQMFQVHRISRRKFVFVTRDLLDA